MSTPLWVSTTRGTSVGTATIEADGTFTLAAHGLVNGQQVTVATLTGGASSVLVVDAPYFAAAATTNTFQLRPAPGAPVMTFTADGSAVVYHAAGVMDAQTLRDGMAGLLGRGDASGGFAARSGVFPNATVTSHVTTSGMTWTVADLVAVVRHSTGRMYITPHATEGGAVTAADPTNPRIDALDLQIQDHTVDSSGFARGRIVYTAGVPAAIPTAPAATANSERLSTWTVAAGATSTGTPTLPRFTVARGGITPVADVAAYPGAGGRYEGQFVWNSATDELVANMTAGSTWNTIASKVNHDYVQGLTGGAAIAGPTSYTPVMAGHGTAVFSTLLGRWVQIAPKLKWWHVFMIVGTAGSGTSVLQVTSPTNPDRTTRQSVQLTTTDGTVSPASRSGSVFTFQTGTGAVWDRFAWDNGGATNGLENMDGSKLTVGMKLFLQGVYWEA